MISPMSKKKNNTTSITFLTAEEVKKLKPKQPKPRTRKNKSKPKKSCFDVPSLSSEKEERQKNRRTHWYLNKDRQKVKMSPTEKRIFKELKSIGIPFHREVCFAGIPLYTFDFYIPAYNLVIEYDGSTHELPEQQLRDKVKNSFCINNNIPIERFNKKHYMTLEQNIRDCILKYKRAAIMFNIENHNKAA